MKINKFNENLEEDDFNGQVKVKDIIKYLSELDPETDVYLDKDGWDANGKNGYEIVKNSYLFDYNPSWNRKKGNNVLFINN